MSEPKKIGRRKYEALKKFGVQGDLSEERLKVFENNFPNTTIGEAIKQIEAYEKERDNTPMMTPEQIQKNKERMERIRNDAPPKKKEQITKDVLWKMFAKQYKINEKVSYDTKNYDSLENIKPLIYYFLGDQTNFEKCSRVSLKSLPDVKSKGLMIIGDFGNGKTSTMRAFEDICKGTNISFKGFTTNKVVQMYGDCQNNLDKELFEKTMQNGIRYFDDLINERDAMNYGRVNIMKEILEERYDKKKLTFISMNYKKGHEGNLDEALNQISERYGDRMYDRIFHAYNIIEFKGKSFRV